MKKLLIFFLSICTSMFSQTAIEYSYWKVKDKDFELAREFNTENYKEYFNTEGKITRKEGTGFNTFIEEYKYDAMGRLSEKVFKDENNMASDLVRYQYNESGVLAQEINTFKNLKWNYYNNRKNEKTKKVLLNDRDLPEEETLFTYIIDETGLKTEIELTTNVYTYTLNHKVVKYNNRGLIEEEHIKSDASLLPNNQKHKVLLYKYKYEFDENDKWVKKTIYLNGAIIGQVRRKFID